jgi:hypothetical protein
VTGKSGVRSSLAFPAPHRGRYDLKTVPMKKFIIILISLTIFILLIFTVTLINQPKNVFYVPSEITINPLIETTFKDVVFLAWDKNLLEIAKIYPKGEMNRKSLNERILAYYSVDAKLTDINEAVTLTFHQNEEFIRGKSQNNFSIRKITFIAKSPEEQRKKLNSICALVRSFKEGILPIKGEKTYDVSYSIYNSDNTGGTSIGLKMGKNKNNSIYVDITPIKILDIKRKS